MGGGGEYEKYFKMSSTENFMRHQLGFLYKVCFPLTAYAKHG